MQIFAGEGSHLGPVNIFPVPVVLVIIVIIMGHLRYRRPYVHIPYRTVVDRLQITHGWVHLILL